MIHLVYRIDNRINGMYYFGVHSTNNSDDNYMGSGTYLKRSMSKYGKDKFEKTILFCFESRKEALNKESELVNEQVLKDPYCYNLIPGGSGKKIVFCYSKFDPDIKYVFSVNTENLKKWADHIEAIEKQYLNTNYSHVITATKSLISCWDKIANNITDLYNNKKKHKTALKMLQSMQKKNVLDCLFVDETKWGTV